MQKYNRPKDASSLIKYYKELLSNVQRYKDYADIRLERIRLYLSINDRRFNEFANDDLNGKNVDAYSSFFGIIEEGYFYLQTVEKCQNFNDYLEFHSSFLGEQLQDASSASNMLSWMFSSSKKKFNAIVAYNYLSRNQFKEPYSRLREDTQFINNILSDNDININNYYENNLEQYRSLINETIKKNDIKFQNVFDINSVIAQNKKLKDIVSEIKRTEYNLEQEAKTSVFELIEHNLIELLKQVPIEEINKNKKGGIRTNSFKEAGINTYADIYILRETDLYKVYGASYYSVCDAKKTVDSFALNAKEKVRIRLNADDKNKYSSKIVQALSNYIKGLSIGNNVASLYEEKGPIVANDIDIIKSKNKCLTWPFESEENRIHTKVIFSSLKETLFGNYWNTISNFYNNINVSISIEDAWKEFSDNPILFNNTLESLFPGILGDYNTQNGLPEDLAEQVQNETVYPDDLLCTLRRYQEWGVKYILHQERVLLGDEMGLGKTIQAIAAMASLKKLGATHFIVVCPASVLTNWCREIEKHSRLTSILVHGKDRERAFSFWLRYGGVAVTNYESAGCFRLSDQFKFSQIVVDEAHYIKNTNAKRTTMVLKMCDHADRVLFMTGTPLENNVYEMINLIKYLNEEVANNVSKIAFMPYAPQFRDEIASVYYRRKRVDVLNELPDLVENKEWCQMFSEEEKQYENMIVSGEHIMRIRQLSWCIDDLKKSCKAKRMLEIIDEAKNNGRKVLIFSYFLDTIYKIKNLLGEKSLYPITGGLSSTKRQDIIDEFDKSEPGTSLICQIMSGGIGLNIQAASVVIICEPQLKPSIENQAISRAYRMGQSRNVLVYRLLCENTIDEIINGILEEKQDIFDAFADESSAAKIEQEDQEISETKLKNIISEELERIKAKGLLKNDNNSDRKSLEDLKKTTEPKDKSNSTNDNSYESENSNNATLKSNFDNSFNNISNKGGSNLILERRLVVPNYEPAGSLFNDSKEINKKEENEIVEFKSNNRIEDININNLPEGYLDMKYDQFVKYLLKKYGPAKGSYFKNPECTIKNRAIARTKEGLYCHHIDEDKAVKLSNPDYAIRYPFEYQLKERLVYCNLLEHLLLHIKIAEKPNNPSNGRLEMFGIGGAICYITKELNDIYSGKAFTNESRVNISKRVIDKFDDYVVILRYFWKVIKSNPNYYNMFTKEDLAKGFDGKVVKRVLDVLKEDDTEKSQKIDSITITGLKINKDNINNDKNYYSKFLNMSYYEAIDCLLKKHGQIKENYFENEKCLIKNSCVRNAAEVGLIIHHIDEDKAVRLNYMSDALKNPFSYQLANRLVYCDLLELFILHIKIIKLHNVSKNDELIRIFDLILLSKKLNDFFSGHGSYNIPIFKKMSELIKDSFDSYIEALRYVWHEFSTNDMYKDLITKVKLSQNFDDSLATIIYEKL